MVAAIEPRREPRYDAAPGREAVGHLYLTCVLAGNRYLVPASVVREVEEIRAVTPVPATPSWLRGVMNLRGTILGVIDLAHFLGLLPAAGASTEALICAPQSAGREADDDLLLALAVDAVSTIRSLAAGEILPVPEQPAGQALPYLIGLYRASGVGGDTEQLIGVLDLESLLRDVTLDQLASPALVAGGAAL